MAAYTGTVIRTTQFGRQDAQLEILGSVAWTSALASADTLTISNFFPEELKLGRIYFEVFGTVPDTNATPTSAIKVGTEDDDDAFIPAIVLNQKTQINVIGTGAAITGATPTITDQRDLVATVTANAATGVTSGTLYFRCIAALQMK